MNLLRTMQAGWLDWLFPSYCAGCNQKRAPPKHPLCYQCLSELPYTNLENQIDHELEQLFWGRIPLRSVLATWYLKPESGLQHCLHQLKYQYRPGIGVFLGKMAGQRMKQHHASPPFDALIPLPLHPGKKRKRGYNQAERICQGLSQATGIPVWDQIVLRNQSTETQTRKDRAQRWNNMEGKFSLHKTTPAMHKHLLLVDDVLTTGATLEACGQTLLQIPGVQLSLFTLAYTENR